MMTSALIVALSLTAAPPQVFKSADGNQWRVTRIAGAAPTSTYEQWYLHVERISPEGVVVETFNFEERAWIEPSPKVIRSTRVVFSLDAAGVFQAVQRESVKHEATPAKETAILFKWNGKSFTQSKLP